MLYPSSSPFVYALGCGANASVLSSVPQTDRRRNPASGPARIGEFLFRNATNEGQQRVTAAIYGMETHGSWREVLQTEVACKATSEMTPEEPVARIRQLDHDSEGQ